MLLQLTEAEQKFPHISLCSDENHMLAEGGEQETHSPELSSAFTFGAQPDLKTAASPQQITEKCKTDIKLHIKVLQSTPMAIKTGPIFDC